jgi:hypothetical protein
MQLCKLAIPAWAGVELCDFTSEAISGGVSGGVYKCSAAGIGPVCVKILNTDDLKPKDSLIDAAYLNWGGSGIIPVAYCLGHPQAPNLEVRFLNVLNHQVTELRYACPGN